MRVLITEFYKFVYSRTGYKMLAYFLGIFYISLLNFVVVNGLALLVQDWVSAAAVLLKLFRFPLSLITFVVCCGITYWLTPAVQLISKDIKKVQGITTILLYSLFGLLLFLYIKFGDAILF